MRNSLILFVLVITQVLGDVCLSHAMKIYGEISSFSPSAIIDVVYYLFTSPWFYVGLGSLTFSWFLYLFCVSKMDLSYVLPIHASSYVFNALFAWLLLQETVTLTRWLATGIISMGVFIVGYSQYKFHKQGEKLRHTLIIDKEKASKILVTLPLGSFFSITWLGVILMVLADSIGDVLNAKGMRQIKVINSFSVSDIFPWLIQIFKNINILIGVSCQAIALLLLVSLLSWDDLSLIRPASAISYLITLISAKYILHEKISRGRFIGICWIMVGVLSLSLS